MIPKIIHYCWYGDKPMPQKHRNFIEQWKTLLKGYEFKFWTEQNSPINQIDYLKTAKNNKKWANISNYMRLYAVYHYGGIYLDTDFQIVKPFDELLDNKCFFGLQQDNMNLINSINNAIFGATPKHWFIKEMLNAITALYDGKETAYLSSPHLTTFLIRSYGFLDSKYIKNSNADITLYPREYFYPYRWDQQFSPNIITPDTYAIHHWEASWAKNELSENIAKKLLKKVCKSIIK